MSLEIENLPIEVRELLKIFGNDARLVGGCVRDLLLKKEVNDFDFATRFLPQKTIEILRQNKIKALETGIKFGTVTAVVNGKNFEITTLREDENQRGRDTDVKFIDDYFLDAQRRDFTINALYLDGEGEIYDYFDGISDLEKREVKFIGDASKRITEDFLRILRFFRFSAKYAEDIDVEGLKACVSQREGLKKLSRERVRQEFFKIFQIENSEKILEGLKVMEKEGVLSEIFSSQTDIKALERVFEFDKSCDFDLKIAAFFLSEAEDVKNFSFEICATNKEKRFFNFLLLNSPDIRLEDLMRLLAFCEKDHVIKFYLFHLSKNFRLSEKYLSLLKGFKVPEFPLAAQDLMDIGLSGKALGDNLLRLKIAWADSHFTFTKDVLLREIL
jgi:poly(A) polymerase